MKRSIVFSIGLAVILLVSYAFAHQSAQQRADWPGHGAMMGYMNSSWFTRMLGGRMGMGYMHANSQMMGQGYHRGTMMGNNMMGASGRGMGPGYMGTRGNHSMRGQQMMNGTQGNVNNPRWGTGPRSAALANPLDSDQTLSRVQGYLDGVGNPNLKTGDLRESDGNFEVDIVTGNGSLVDKLLIDKNTGWLRSAYRVPQSPLNAEQAQALIERLITFSENPNLKPGKIQETENGFEVEIQTKNNDPVGKVLVDPGTGWIRDAQVTPSG